jgi:hypothetical protein
MASEISIGSATSNAVTGHIDPAQAIWDIQSGKYAKQIDALRRAAGDDRDKLKKLLPAYLWTGKFTCRRNTGIETYSGLLCADIDKIPDRVGELHDIARQDPHVVAAFVSPSGAGIKIVFRVPVAADAADHHRNFVAVRAHVASHYKAQVDEAAKDVARLCFVSHDPAAFYNAEAVPLVETLPIGNKEQIQSESNPQVTSINQARELAPGPITQGNRNNAAFQLGCKCRDAGKTPAEAENEVLDFAAKCNPPLPQAEAIGCVRSAYSQPPRPPVIELPPLVDAAAFIAQPIAPPAELVAGILHTGSKLAFGGSSKSFKTWSLLDLAISVATGSDWLGRATAQGKVLFVNFEIQPHAWQRRIVAVAQAKGVELAPGQITLWNLRGHAADFRQLIPRIIERCRRENFALIILDPIYKLYGGTDENAAGDVAALLNSLEALATETGAAIAFGAHFAKGNASAKEAIDRISGSGVFARDPDSLLIFTKHEEDDAFTVEPILRNFAPVAPFAVRWDFPLMRLADDLDPAKLKQAAGRKPTILPDDLLTILPDGGLSNADWLAKAEAQGISRRTFFRLRKALENAARIHLSPISEYWQPILTK